MSDATINYNTSGGTNFQLTDSTLAGTTSSTGTTPTGLQIPTGYDRGDTTGTSSLSNPTMGLVNPQHPLLPAPQNGESLPTTLPALTNAQQTIVLASYNDQLSDNANKALMASVSPPLTAAQQQTLQQAIQTNTPPTDLTLLSLCNQQQTLQQAVHTNTPPTDPTLLPIYNTAVATTELATQVEYLLPNTWTVADGNQPNSLDWIPSQNNVGPFNTGQQTTINTAYNTELLNEVATAIQTASSPLTPPQVIALQQAVVNGTTDGTDPTVDDIYNDAVTQATNNIMNDFSLPATWTPGTTDATALTPVVTVGLTGAQSSQLLMGNAITLAGNAKTAVQSLLGPMTGTPGAVLMADFLKVIATAIDFLKQGLQNMQLAQTQLQQKLTAAQYSQLDGRRTVADAKLQAQQEQYKKAEDAANSHSKMASVMKILGPIVAAVCCIVGAIAMIAGGAGTALIVAGIAIGIAMTSYSIADSQLGLTQKLMSAFGSFLDSLGSPGKYLFGAAITAIAAAILVCCAIASPGSGVSVGMQIAAQTTEQVTIQMTVAMLMGSNVIGSVIGPMVAAMGGGAIAQEIISAIVMFIVIAAMSSMGGGPKNPDEALKSGSTSMSQAASNFANSIKTGVSEAASSLKAAISDALKGMQDALTSPLETLNAAISSGINSIGDAIQNFVTSIKNFLSSTGEVDQAAQDEVEAFGQQAKEFLVNNRMWISGVTKAVLQAGPLAVQAADNFIQAAAMLAIAALISQIASLTGAMTIIKQMLKMLQKLMTDLGSGQMDISTAIGQCQKQIMALFDKLNASLQPGQAING